MSDSVSNSDDKITLKVHGLKVDKDLVRAEVFVEKLSALVSALKSTDKIEHEGKVRHHYIITDLKIGSALATLREKPKSLRNMPVASSVERLSQAVALIYDGDVSRAAELPASLIHGVQRMTNGVSKSFSHAEVSFPKKKIIRVDEFLAGRVKEVVEHANQNRSIEKEYFQGTAFGSFEGVLQELDARGTLLRGKLILSVGGVELDCVMNRDDIPRIRENFDKRVNVEALAYYDGRQPLPIRLEIRHIEGLEEVPDLMKWRGAFDIKEQDDFEGEW